MKWIEIKMRELGVSTHDSYKVTAFLDNTAMVTVHSAERGMTARQMPTALEQCHVLERCSIDQPGRRGPVDARHREL